MYNKEEQGFAHMLFVFVEAVHMLLVYRLKNRFGLIDDLGLKNEPKKAYDQYRDGIVKARNGMDKFTNYFETLYAEHNEALFVDKLRKEASNLIVDFMKSSNEHSDDDCRFSDELIDKLTFRG